MIITVKPNGIKVLTPEAGYPVVTNGEIYTDRVVLGVNASENDWRDATQQEYEEWQRREEEPDISDAEALNIILGGTSYES